jgi:hypothetical protein
VVAALVPRPTPAMFSAIQKRLTYANVVATLALVFAMGGSAVAAKHYLVNSTKQINPKVLKKLKGHNGQNGKTGPTGPAGPATGPAGGALPGNYPNPGLAGGAVGTANFAPTATAPNATNAAALGGLAASGYTQRSCASLTGQVKGFVGIAASGTFSSTFVPVGGYNCSGGAIEAKRLAEGVYEVKYVGSPVQGCVGNSDNGNVDAFSCKALAAGDFEVRTYNVPSAHLLDDPFFIMSP